MRLPRFRRNMPESVRTHLHKPQGFRLHTFSLHTLILLHYTTYYVTKASRLPYLHPREKLKPHVSTEATTVAHNQYPSYAYKLHFSNLEPMPLAWSTEQQKPTAIEDVIYVAKISIYARHGGHVCYLLISRLSAFTLYFLHAAHCSYHIHRRYIDLNSGTFVPHLPEGCAHAIFVNCLCQREWVSDIYCHSGFYVRTQIEREDRTTCWEDPSGMLLYLQEKGQSD
jgi:hypothetical protein